MPRHSRNPARTLFWGVVTASAMTGGAVWVGQVGGPANAFEIARVASLSLYRSGLAAAQAEPTDDAISTESEAPSGAAIADVAAIDGEAVFEESCAFCHQVGEGAAHIVGPALNSLPARQAGAVHGFDYSQAMARAGADGLVWTDETLHAFLSEPEALVPGTTMSYAGLNDYDARAAVIAYVASFANVDVVDGEDSFPIYSERVSRLLEIPADIAYGEYLSTECAACHQLSGGDDGIPAIVGWPRGRFIHALDGYRSGEREHPVMTMVARSLGDDELAALAAYFETVTPE